MAYAKYTEYLSPKCFEKTHEQYWLLMDGENKAHWFVFQGTEVFLYGTSRVQDFQSVEQWRHFREAVTLWSLLQLVV